MQYPVCEDSKLAIAERQGIEIDYCPACRGVWLDRGELDKVIERSAESRGESDRDKDHPPGSERSGSHGKKHKRKSMLSELFDF